MASSFYPTIFKHLLEGTVDLTSGTQATKPVKIMLLNDTYTFDVSHNDVADIVGHEISGSGYSRKVVSVTLDQDLATPSTAGCFVTFDLTGDASWTSATFETQGAAMFLDGEASDGARRLLYYFDFGAKQVVSSGTFSLLDPSPQPKLRRYVA